MRKILQASGADNCPICVGRLCLPSANDPEIHLSCLTAFRGKRDSTCAIQTKKTLCPPYLYQTAKQRTGGSRLDPPFDLGLIRLSRDE